jgi:hypothetical protein
MFVITGILVHPALLTMSLVSDMRTGLVANFLRVWVDIIGWMSWASARSPPPPTCPSITRGRPLLWVHGHVPAHFGGPVPGVHFSGPLPVLTPLPFEMDPMKGLRSGSVIRATCRCLCQHFMIDSHRTTSTYIPLTLFTCALFIPHVIDLRVFHISDIRITVADALSSRASAHHFQLRAQPLLKVYSFQPPRRNLVFFHLLIHCCAMQNMLTHFAATGRLARQPWPH